MLMRLHIARSHLTAHAHSIAAGQEGESARKRTCRQQALQGRAACAVSALPLPARASALQCCATEAAAQQLQAALWAALPAVHCHSPPLAHCWLRAPVHSCPQAWCLHCQELQRRTQALRELTRRLVLHRQMQLPDLRPQVRCELGLLTVLHRTTAAGRGLAWHWSVAVLALALHRLEPLLARWCPGMMTYLAWAALPTSRCRAQHV